MACLVAPTIAATAQTAPQLTISSVAGLDGDARLTITGTNFGTEVPAVKLGGASLQILSNSDTEIVAELPTLSPGAYVLAISRDGGATPEGSASVAIVIRGSAVAIGPQAPARDSVTITRGLR